MSYGQYPHPQYVRIVVERNGQATASLVLGIVALVFSFIPLIGMSSWVLAPMGLIFGLLAGGRPVGSGARWAGIITSSIALLICCLWVLMIVIGHSKTMGV